jgi:biotin carboxyl carrier protein
MKWQILVDGKPVDIDNGHLNGIREVEPGVYSVILGGKAFEVRVLPGSDAWNVNVDGRIFSVEVNNPRDSSRVLRAALGSGRQSVTAPMPGKVIRVLVAQGETVDAGQGLVVVEAMKMQNEMKAARPGRIVEVRVQAGDTVGAGETLVVFE